MESNPPDREKRKFALTAILQEAAHQDVIRPEQCAMLADFLVDRGVGRLDAGVIETPMQSTGLAAPRDEPPAVDEDSEAPRFVRGFHDILITIGVVAALAGLGGLLSALAIPVAVVVLAEILVRRQRLALPAVVLTIAFAASSGYAVWASLKSAWPNLAEDPLIVWSGLGVAVLLGLFYLRYKVPLALSALLALGFGVAVEAVALGTWSWSGDPLFYAARPWLIGAFVGIFAFSLFSTALYFDLGDRMRRTRRSDVAFWLHLVAAPALLYTILAFVYLHDPGGLFSSDPSLTQAAVILFAVAALMIIGILLDRRAFATSGLLSLGYAFKVILSDGGFKDVFGSAESVFFVILICIGLIVLSLGIGWQSLRVLLVERLPSWLKQRLPPAEARG